MHLFGGRQMETIQGISGEDQIEKKYQKNEGYWGCMGLYGISHPPRAPLK